MSVATATPEELARLDNFVVLLRGATVGLWASDKTIAALVQDWNTDILQIIGAPQNTVIKDSNSLTGSLPLTDTQVTTLFGIFQTLQTNAMTANNKDLFMRATGPNNAM